MSAVATTATSGVPEYVSNSEFFSRVVTASLIAISPAIAIALLASVLFFFASVSQGGLEICRHGHCSTITSFGGSFNHIYRIWVSENTGPVLLCQTAFLVLAANYFMFGKIGNHETSSSYLVTILCFIVVVVWPFSA